MTTYIRKVFGDQKEAEFQSTQWADCLVSVSKNSDKLSVNKKAMECMHRNFGRVVSLVGRPGVGKSTLASCVYNLMRSDKAEYFEISDCMQSFTKGIWCLNEHTKVLKSKLDEVDKCPLDILDLEGLANSNSIHYLVVVAMALSDAIVLCDLGMRFNFDALDTIMAGIRIYREKKINLPPPTIYLQVQYGENKFKINKGNEVDRAGFVAWIKREYAEFNGFDVRLFSVNFDHKEEDRFHDAYLDSVKAWMRDLASIPARNVAIEDRVKYASTMVQALNNNSPDMIVKLNFKFFKDEAVQIAIEAESSAKRRLKIAADTQANTVDKRLSPVEFFALIGERGKLYYGKNIKHQVTALSFFDASDVQYLKFVTQYDVVQQFSLYARDHCEDSYQEAMEKVKSLMTAKGNALKVENHTSYKEFVTLEVNRAINNIKFNGSTGLPYDVQSTVQEKRRQLRQEIIEKTQGFVELDADYLNLNVLHKTWETQVNILKTRWEERKSAALGANKEKVITSGNHKCGSCGKEHVPGATHKECGVSGTLYYWVDAQTHTCICDGCKELKQIWSVCCWTCSTTLDVQIVPSRN